MSAATTSSVRLVPVSETVASSLAAAMSSSDGGGVSIRATMSQDGFGTAAPPPLVALLAGNKNQKFPCCAALSSSPDSQYQHHQLIVPMLQSAARQEQQHRVVADDEGRCLLVAASVPELRAFVQDARNGFIIPFQNVVGGGRQQFAQKCEELTARGIEATQAILETIDVGKLAGIESELETELKAKGKKAAAVAKTIIVPVDEAESKNSGAVFAEISFA